MSKMVKNNIRWVGKIDWELRKFHGDEYSTHRGSSYNSYLVREEKTFLIDTVWMPFAKEFVANLKKEIDLDKIDFIVANHGEIDHSGALPELMRYIPDTPIYCTAQAVKSIKGQYHQDWNFKVVKTGDSIEVGNGKKLVFVEMPMLHWPDSMLTYLTGDAVMFSNDAFGQHYASENLFNDKVDQDELWQESIKYYANILTPFSKQATKKINEVLSLELPLDMICTSHGVIWRDNPAQIVKKYLEWADCYQEDQITILYDTMWNATRRMAESIAEGVKLQNPHSTIKLFNISRSDKNDMITEIFKSRAVLIGSPTINNGILVSVAGILEEIKGLKFQNKKAAAFGSYGWSGESVKVITEKLRECGFEILNEGIKALWNPDEVKLEEIKQFGHTLTF